MSDDKKPPIETRTQAFDADPYPPGVRPRLLGVSLGTLTELMMGRAVCFNKQGDGIFREPVILVATESPEAFGEFAVKFAENAIHGEGFGCASAVYASANVESNGTMFAYSTRIDQPPPGAGQA